MSKLDLTHTQETGSKHTNVHHDFQDSCFRSSHVTKKHVDTICNTLCPICNEKLGKGIISMLPFCYDCNPNYSLLVHMSCGRRYLNYDSSHVKKSLCGKVEHLTTNCQQLYPLPCHCSAESMLIPSEWNGVLDKWKIPVGKCNYCDTTMDTRMGMYIHMNTKILKNNNINTDKLSLREKKMCEKRHIGCLNNFMKCTRCGLSMLAGEMTGHAQFCHGLPEEKCKIYAENVKSDFAKREIGYNSNQKYRKEIEKEIEKEIRIENEKKEKEEKSKADTCGSWRKSSEENNEKNDELLSEIINMLSIDNISQEDFKTFMSSICNKDNIPVHTESVHINTLC